MPSIFIRISIAVIILAILAYILFKFIPIKKLEHFKPKQELAAGPDGAELLKKYENNELDDEQFLKLFSKVKIYYSTPWGDTKDGGSQLFLLESPSKPGQTYHPVFISTESATEYFEKAGRAGFLLIEGDLLHFIKSTLEIYEDAPSKVGAVIEPYKFNFILDAEYLDDIIKMMES